MTHGNNNLIDIKEQVKAYGNNIKQAVLKAAGGSEIGSVLQNLLKEIPQHLHDEVIKEFRKLIEEFNDDYEEAIRNKEAENKKLYEMIPANIMAKIKNMLKTKPDLKSQLETIGKELLKSGIKVSDLQKIDLNNFDQAISSSVRDTKTAEGKPGQGSTGRA